MIILDTDIFTLLAIGHAAVVRHVREAQEPIAITIVARIEVLQGRFSSVVKAKDGAQVLQAQARLTRSIVDLESLPTVYFDERAGAIFDSLKKHKKAKSIGQADLIAASIALAQQAEFATRNLRHFRRVPGLRVVNWCD